MVLKSKWRILFCDETEKVCPVTEFINQCPPKHQVKILRLLSIEKQKESLDKISKSIGMSRDSYDALKSGDLCRPQEVLALCRLLKIEDSDLVNHCPRL